MSQLVTPQLRSTNWERTRAFYVDGLGFTVQWIHQFEPGFPVFGEVTLDGRTLFLTEHTGDCEVGGAVDILMDDVDAFHRTIAARGVPVLEPPEEAPWGVREMMVVDPNGNRLRFANPQSSTGRPTSEIGQRFTNVLDPVGRFRGNTGFVSDCCCPAPAQTADRPTCGGCSNAGTLVDLHTVKALLTDIAMRRLDAAVFYFCADAACPTVYFAADGQRFVTTDVRVAVWQKEPEGARTVCYCFGENEADMRREMERDGSTQAVGRVREHIAAQRCACEVRNPRGACCLGDVTAAVKRTVAAMEFAG